ncbi:MAG: hypothetical protein AB2A00_10115 [Myxococcota bacterium]
MSVSLNAAAQSQIRALLAQQLQGPARTEPQQALKNVQETAQKLGISAGELARLVDEFAKGSVNLDAGSKQALANFTGQNRTEVVVKKPLSMSAQWAVKTGQLAPVGQKPAAPPAETLTLGANKILMGDGAGPENIRLSLGIVDGKPTVTLRDASLAPGGTSSFNDKSLLELRVNGKPISAERSVSSQIPYGPFEGDRQVFLTAQASVDKSSRIEVYDTLKKTSTSFQVAVEPRARMDAGKLEAQRTEVMGAFKAKDVDDVKARAGNHGKMAAAYAELSANQFLQSPNAAYLDENQVKVAREALADVTRQTTAHFGPGGFVEGDGAVAGRHQHVGYVAGELARNFGLPKETARAALDAHFRGIQKGTITWENGKDALTEKLVKAAPADKKDALKALIADGNNGWMFGAYGWGKSDTALNMPGRYAAEATLKFAHALAGGDEREGARLMDKLFDPRTDQAALLASNDGNLALLAQFAARAAQAGWLTSKIGQGIVEAHHAKPEKAAKGPDRWNHKLITDFNTLSATKGWVEVAKDLDQIESGYKQLARQSSL